MKSSFTGILLLAGISIPLFSAAQGYITNKENACKLYVAGGEDRRSFILIAGSCVDGYLSGEATVDIYQDGKLYVTYTGRFDRGVLNGTAKGMWTNGHIFEGSFVDGLRKEGTYTFAEGQVYKGTFNLEGKREGTGTMSFSDGSLYTGEFRNDRRAGQGILKMANGDKYIGMFDNDRLHGRGVHYMKNGDRLESDFYEDAPAAGNSIYYFANGDRYEGRFTGLNSEYKYNSGEGKLYRTDGSILSGQIKNNIFIEERRYADWGDIIGDADDPGKEPIRTAAEIMQELEPLVESEDIFPTFRIAFNYEADPKSIEISSGGNSLVYSWKALDARSNTIYIDRYVIKLSNVKSVFAITDENRVFIGCKNDDECIHGYEDNLTRGITNYDLGTKTTINIYTRDGEAEKVSALVYELVALYNNDYVITDEDIKKLKTK